MGIGLIIKIAAVGLLVSILSQILNKSGREEQAFLVTIAGILLVLGWILPYIAQILDLLEQMFQFSP